MNILYLDLFNGISGDMVLSAFLDAGLPIEVINNNVEKILNKNEFSIKTFKKKFNNITGSQISVSESPLIKRKYKSIKESILSSSLDEKIKKTSINILNALAKAESIIHNCSVEDVHFHEIGAVDTIVDIIGVATGIHFFGINKIFISEIPVGTGEILSSHGVIPNPAPATANLLKNYTLKFMDLPYEITTPTGAAIICGLGATQKNIISLHVKHIGYGFGTLETNNRINCLRAFIGNSPVIIPNNSVYEIEFNIDDMTGEEIGYFIEKATKKNIADIQCIPSVTKKNRPGYIFKILTETVTNELIDFILTDSSTSGFRVTVKERVIMDRINSQNKNTSLFQIKRMTEERLNIRKRKLEFDSLKNFKE